MSSAVMQAGAGLSASEVAARIDGLRILALCEFVPSVSCGGSDHVAWQVYRRLAAMGAEVTLLTCASPGTPKVDASTEGVRILGLPCVDLARLLRAEAIFSPTLFQQAFRQSRFAQAAVIHANGLHFQSTLAAAMVRTVRPVPLVTTAHIGSLRHLGRALRGAVNAHERTVGRFILRASDRVIAVSPSVARHLETLGVPDRKVTVIVNGVDHDVFRPDQWRRARRVPRVVFVGRLIPNKGPALFLRALERLDRLGLPFEALFVGDGPSREELERQTVAAGLAARVTFTGHATDVASYLRGADVFVRPSLTEGMPLAVLEAMASGVCVIASDAEGNTDLVKHRDNGLLFSVGDLDGLVGQLALVLSHDGLRRCLARNGLVTAAFHSWERCAQATGRVLLEAAAGQWRSASG